MAGEAVGSAAYKRHVRPPRAGGRGGFGCDSPVPALPALLQRLAVLGHVEPFDLVLLAHPQRDQERDHLEQDEGERPRPDQDRDDAVELDQQLSRIAFEQARRPGVSGLADSAATANTPVSSVPVAPPTP